MFDFATHLKRKDVREIVQTAALVATTLVGGAWAVFTYFVPHPVTPTPQVSQPKIAASDAGEAKRHPRHLERTLTHAAHLDAPSVREQPQAVRKVSADNGSVAIGGDANGTTITVGNASSDK